MRDLTRALDGLRDQLAAIQREIFVLERIGRELAALSERCDDAGLDLLIRRHLDGIAHRMTSMLDRQRSVAGMIAECGRETRRATRVAAINLPRRRKLSSARPIAGWAEKPLRVRRFQKPRPDHESPAQILRPAGDRRAGSVPRAAVAARAHDSFRAAAKRKDAGQGRRTGGAGRRRARQSRGCDPGRIRRPPRATA